MITVYQLRNNLSLSTLNQRRNLTLEQVNVMLHSCYDAQEVKLLKLTLKRSAFQRRNNIILLTFN